ncbi:MAG: aminomethyl-transferring glycine dehydrogenase [Zoogloeaceae bacterium]|nr:aminomethyl-transferring glycine dehydrogenase [Zoogloeaceae bacterium]
MSPSSSALAWDDEFLARHLGPDVLETTAMLRAIGVESLEDLVVQTIPATIRLDSEPKLPAARAEHEALAALRTLASRNLRRKNLIGQGFHDTIIPSVILRNVLENPGWYTAYTPYQAEIAQGRLEAMLTFQEMTIELTGMEVANASLLDEASAAAEAMSMARRVSKSPSRRFLVDPGVFPRTLAVLQTRAAGLGFELVCGRPEAQSGEFFGALLQYPDALGETRALDASIAALKEQGAVVAVATDPLALVLLKPPGAMGADIVFGSSQRFGTPPGFGGPHAAFFAGRAAHMRAMPGRIIGVSRDANGKRALRMALQTREQHIRREKANSNICTAQALLANMAAFYAVYHGPAGLRRIAARIHRLAAILAEGLREKGIVQLNQHYFDTLRFNLGERTADVLRAADQAGYNLHSWATGEIGVAVNEKTTPEDVAALLAILSGEVTMEKIKEKTGEDPAGKIAALDASIAVHDPALPASLLRRDEFLTHPVFHRYHTEHAMLRYLKKLQNRDLALDHAMIPLGSCTMKLNATSAMLPVTWPEFADLHPLAPPEQAAGLLAMIGELSGWLASITGFDAVFMEPNSGAQGEYAGLVAIRRYHERRGEGGRDVCLIPASAHGTNPASARLAGFTVVNVACDGQGNVDLADLAAKAKTHAARLACLMLTYPSTHGVFEEAVREICDLIHAQGGQVYMDGANLNAQVGLTAPGSIGADVSHINLHKTFAMPHGGGGPGMGPIGLKAHLAEALRETPWDAPLSFHVCAAPFGSASLLPIAWMYIAMLGGRGLAAATRTAILNANYIASRLHTHYPVLYTGARGRVAHECILDIRPVKAATGITETDIAKRLMDYGFHAPTVSFPVPGALMVEPTESENKAELDRFIAALIAIREEIRKVERGIWPADDNPLKNAPHPQETLTAAEWRHPYSRAEAVFPLPWVAENKFWPHVARIDDVYGDRNLLCRWPQADFEQSDPGFSEGA